MATGLRAAIEYLTTTRTGEKGPLTVPKEFRDELGLGHGAPVAVLRLGNGLLLLPEQRRFDRLCERVTAALARAGADPEALLARLPAARQTIFTRRYKGLAPMASAHPRRRDRREP